jgi:hypothetical protein
LTLQIDGLASISPERGAAAEPLPTAELPEGGGLVRTRPDREGRWQMRAYAFLPTQIVARAGEVVGLNFVGVQGANYTIAVDGVAEPVALSRGEVRRVEIAAREPGIIRFAALGHLPTMQGQLLVLPAD